MLQLLLYLVLSRKRDTYQGLSLLHIVASAGVCLVTDAAKFKQLAEEARKLKQAKKQARRERRKPPPPKAMDEAAVRLAEHNVKVEKRERELHRAKADQQKAELAAQKRKLLVQRDKALKKNPPPSSCDPDEGKPVIPVRQAQLWLPVSLSFALSTALCEVVWQL